jgi:hypothetical protein
VLALAACGGGVVIVQKGYDGPRRPQGEVALIEGEDHMGFVGLDGSYWAVKDEGKAAPRLEVLPGDHTLAVDWSRPGERTHILGSSVTMTELPLHFAFPVRLTFAAQAGHKYDVKTLAKKRVAYRGRDASESVLPEVGVFLVDRSTEEVLDSGVGLLRR